MKSMYTDKLRFIEKAVSDDATRYFICYPYYDKDECQLVATDGRRLHIFKLNSSDINNLGLTEVEASTYVKIDAKAGRVYPIKQDGIFPNYKRVIPDNIVKDEKKLSLNTKNEKIAGIPRFYVRSGMVVNYDYLADCVGFTWEVYFVKTDGCDAYKEKALTLKTIVEDKGYSELTAIIMPMLQEDN